MNALGAAAGNRRGWIIAALAIGLLAAGLPATSTAAAGRRNVSGGDDVTVVAILDNRVNPYHWDFLASKMPQALDKDRSNDLPLGTPPSKWLRGFPSEKAFDSVVPLKLSLNDKDRNAPLPGGYPEPDIDKREWAKLEPSAGKKINYGWIPGTKVIGAIDFSPTEPLFGDNISHGVGTTSVSVGNIHGTCPECLLVFIDYGPTEATAEAAIKWAMSQSWIDVVSNSYGHGSIIPKIYNGMSQDQQRRASERGQTIFFSAGNGIENLYTVTNPTYMTSQKGPDWLITVGAVNAGADNHYKNPLKGRAEHASYTGAGKPVDIAGIGSDYPAAYLAETVGGTGGRDITGGYGFGGTSNATPTVAGHYARALYLARLALDGPSRIQQNGVIATGGGFRCSKTRPDCELGDGKLTASELRTRLLHGAIHTPAGMTTLAQGAQTPAIGEEEFMNEGHGTYFARETRKDKDWLNEFERIIGPIFGRAKTLKRPAGERDWMVVDSFCRQSIWGPWKGGYYVKGKTDLPGADPSYPVRSLLEQTCPSMVPPPP